MRSPAAAADASATARFTAALRALANDAAPGAALDVELAALASQALRDCEPDPELVQALLALLPAAWARFECADLCKLHTLVIGVLQLPELAAAAPADDPWVAAQLTDAALLRAARPADEAEAPTARDAGGLCLPEGRSGPWRTRWQQEMRGA